MTTISLMLPGLADLVWTQGEHGGEVTHTASLCGLDIVVQVCVGDPVHGEPVFAGDMRDRHLMNPPTVESPPCPTA